VVLSQSKLALLPLRTGPRLDILIRRKHCLAGIQLILRRRYQCNFCLEVLLNDRFGNIQNYRKLPTISSFKDNLKILYCCANFYFSV